MAKAARKGRQPAPQGEDKQQKFRRLATLRVQKAVKAIEIVGNLAGSAYSYTPPQVEKITQVLTDTLNSTLEKFNAEGTEEAGGFEL